MLKDSSDFAHLFLTQRNNSSSIISPGRDNEFWIRYTMQKTILISCLLILMGLTISCQNAPPKSNPLHKVKTQDFRQFEQRLQQLAKKFSSSIEIEVLAAGDSPVLSPNGQYIAFSSEGNMGGNHIWIMDVKGTKLQQLTHFDGDSSPQWSPDSRKIIFVSFGPKNLFDPRNWGGVETRKSSIWTVDIDGKNLRQLVPSHSKGDYKPSWSPNGKHIVWTRGNYLWIADTQGQKARPLATSTGGLFAELKWSSDSQTLYISSGGETQRAHPQCTVQTWTAIDIIDQNNPRQVQKPFEPVLQESVGSFRYCVDQSNVFKLDHRNRKSQLLEYAGGRSFERAMITLDRKTLIVGFTVKGSLYDSILALKLKEKLSTSKFMIKSS